jgi:hypothetical protein
MGGRRLALMILLGLLPVSATSVAAQRSAARQASQVFATTRVRNCFGVMGQVRSPGTYEFKSQYPRLGEVIRHAGGLTAGANGNIRIIHRGRAGQQTFYSPQLPLHLQPRLIPGDVIVVDERQGWQSGVQTTRHGRRILHQAPPANKTVSSPPVQVAFVNLVDRPVVLNLKSEYATLPKVLSLLGQPLEILPSVRVLETTPSRGFSPRNRMVPARLSSGSILVFDPTVIQFDQLPPLPDPFTIEGPYESADKMKSAEAMAERGVDKPSSDVNKPSFDVNKPSFDGGSAGQVPDGSELASAFKPSQSSIAQPDLLRNAEQEEPLLDEFFPEMAAGVQPQTDDSPREASSFLTDVVEFGLPTARAEMSTTLTTGGFGIESGVVSVTGDNKDSWDTSALIAGIFGGLVLCSAGFFLWSLARRAVKPRVRPVPQGEGRVLDALINNELPLTEETFQLPLTLEFYGRPTGPIKIRIDAAHQLSGPHFPPDNAGDEAPGRTSVVLMPEADENSESPSAAAAGKQPTEQVHPAADYKFGLLDRVLSSVHGASQL